eukprot:1162070-Pelagomonas_calceolata.AAC.7
MTHSSPLRLQSTQHATCTRIGMYQKQFEAGRRAFICCFHFNRDSHVSRLNMMITKQGHRQEDRLDAQAGLKLPSLPNYTFVPSQISRDYLKLLVRWVTCGIENAGGSGFEFNPGQPVQTLHNLSYMHVTSSGKGSNGSGSYSWSVKQMRCFPSRPFHGQTRHNAEKVGTDRAGYMHHSCPSHPHHGQVDLGRGAVVLLPQIRCRGDAGHHWQVLHGWGMQHPMAC